MSYPRTGPGTMAKEISLGEDAELRLILVGKSRVGKSTTGNTILGRREFESLGGKATTLRCQRGQGRWQDRKISVIDTPDIFDSENHSERVQNEIRACVELSRPGPHALIFVTQVGRFTAEDVTAAKRVWDIFEAESARYMIVLFTCKEDLGGQSLQEYVQNSKNRNLGKLIQRCGNRYCGFNNMAPGVEWQAQVSELMKMVERVVFENGGRHYVNWLYELSMADTDEAAKPAPVSLMDAPLPPADGEWEERMMDVTAARRPGEDAKLRLILVGKPGGGKKDMGHIILGQPVFHSIQKPNTTTVKCKWGEARWKDRKIFVVLTPDIFYSENHSELVEKEIKACVELSRPGPHALIFVTQVGRFTPEDVTAAKRVRDIFGDESTKHTIVLFTREEELRGESLQEYVQKSDNSNLRDLIQRCGYNYCGFNDKVAGAEQEKQISLLMETVQRVILENRGRHYVIPLHKGPKAATDEEAKPVPVSPMDAPLRPLDREWEDLLMDVTADGKWKDVTTDITAAGTPGPDSVIDAPLRSTDGEREELTMEGEDAALRMILVGKSGGGKSATGNTILGRRVFESVLSAKTTTLKCQRGQGRWQNRMISVFDTPNIFDSENYSEMVKTEIGACVEFSRQGPHALIFVTQVGRFTAEDVTAAKRVWDIFGDESARRTIVLFTCKEDLGEESLQEYIRKSDNPNLRELVQRCGNRFCGFNNKAAGAEWQAQVSELMGMVPSVVSENRRRHYVIQLPKVPKKSPDSSCANRPEMAESIRGPERRIVLVGRTGSGKSATGNTILGSKVFGMTPMSDTKHCQREEVLWNGRRIVVVNTPGFLDTWCPERANAAEVSECVKLCSPGPHVILWVMRPGCFSQEKDVAQMIQGIFNQKGRNYMIILFTDKYKLKSHPLENFSFFQDKKEYIAEYGNRYLAFNNTAKGNEREAQMAELMKMIDRLVHENGDAVYYTEDMLKKDVENFNKTRASSSCPIV